nr:DDE-type integrase/transposase/recombinase [Acetobacter senegalensis]
MPVWFDSQPDLNPARLVFIDGTAVSTKMGRLRGGHVVTRDVRRQMENDRCSRSVHLAVYDAENANNSVDFLKAVKTAFPFRITHILTDRGSCFTADAFEKACQDMGIDRRRTKAYSPQTNGMVERFNGRVTTEMLPVCVSSHKDLEILLRGFCRAYNHRPQRVLGGISPAKRISSWLEKHSASRNPDHIKPASRDIMKQVDEILDYANDVSQPDS